MNSLCLYLIVIFGECRLTTYTEQFNISIDCGKVKNTIIFKIDDLILHIFYDK